MSELEKLKYVYFIGIGGIGMSALARYFNSRKVEVAGYDKTASVLTAQLITEGMDVHFEDDLSLVPQDLMECPREEVLIVYTPAVPSEHTELKHFISSGYNVMKRSGVLGKITERFRTIAIAGTHGKTTTSTMVTHILRTCNIDCRAFLGGISLNFGSNVLLGNSDITVVEADEYDRSFLTLYPHVAVITSLDPDHLDIYGSAEGMLESYAQFARQVKPEGLLIIREGLKEMLGSFGNNVVEYSVSGKTTNRADKIRVENGRFVYDVIAGDHLIRDISLGVPGRHNVENSVAAVAAALYMGADEAGIRKAIATYKGVKRRFEYYIRRDDLVLIDDYAHHPAELTATIRAVRELYPTRKVTGIFQPHLYTRTRDFADEFARSLELLDELVLMDIYPAREHPIPGITSAMLMQKVKLKNKVLASKKDLAEVIASGPREVVLMMGAGDIELFVEPVKNALEA